MVERKTDKPRINSNLNQSMMQEEGSAHGHNASLTSVAVNQKDTLKTPESDYFHRVDLGLEDSDDESKKKE